MESLTANMAGAAYIPLDRCLALSRGESLPERTSGAAMFADVSGFTPLTEALVREFGSRRAAEELTRSLNEVYGTLIDQVHRYGGSVVSFAGDAITCWFDRDDGLRATTCGLAMQRAMARFVDLSLAIKVSVATGPARRWTVGDPRIQLIDVLAGATLDRMARAGKLTEKGEVVVHSETAAQLGSRARVRGWREDATGEQFAIVESMGGADGSDEIAPEPPPATLPPLSETQARPWTLPPVYERLKAGQGRFLAELRPAVALFLKFGGLDYDRDEEAGRKLDAYICWVQNVLARYDSYLFQLIVGDKGSYLYAAFGAPLAHDDDAARAVAAALELRTPPPNLRFISPIQIGLSQGQMRAGDYGSVQPAAACRCTYGVLGDEVTVAARLMEESRPGEVWVSQRVADDAARSFRFEYLDTIPLKGKRKPLQVYLPLDRRLVTPRTPTHPLTVPLIGRESELAQAQPILQAVLAGQGQILRLEGGPGVGKSRLGSELVTLAKDRGLNVAVGACLSTGQSVAYSAWRPVFRALFNLTDEPGPQDLLTWITGQVNHVQTVISHVNPDLLPRLPLLSTLLNLPIPDNSTTATLDPELRQQWLFALAIEMMQAWAATIPLLVLVDDVQWMDEASLRLTLSLGWAITRAPIWLILIHRTQEEAILPELGHQPHHHHLVLGDLSLQGIASLLAYRLRSPLSPLALSLVRAYVQGNPFFACELADTLQEAGSLVQEGHTWTLSRPLFDALQQAHCLVRQNGGWALRPDAPLSTANLNIPDSIQRTVLARMDRLTESPKVTLKVASVVGQTAGLPLLAQAHPGRPELTALLEQVKELEGRNMLRQHISPVGALSYAFQDNVTREVAYETLLAEQQRELHRATAEALEWMQPEAVEQLAYHYGRGGVRDKALLYLGKAAGKAQQEYANEIALDYYRQALALEDRWEWRKGEVQCLHILGQREDELAALKALESHLQAPAAEVAYMWGQYYEAMGDYKRAQSAVNRAATACWKSDDRVGQARCLAQGGLIARRQGDYERAHKWYQQALVLFKEQEVYVGEEGQALAQALGGLGTVHRQQSHFSQARECYERALTLSRACGDRRHEAEVLSNLGSLLYLQRQLEQALLYYQQALEIRRAIGDRAGEGVCLLNLAQVNLDTGDYGQAEQNYTDALSIQQAIGNRWEEVNIWLGLGALCLELGDLTQAQNSIRQSLQLAQVIGDQAGQAYSMVNLGLALRDAEQYDAACTVLTDGLKLAQAQADRYLVSSYFSYLSAVYLQTNRLDQAIEQAQAALALRQELNMRLRMADDLATLAAAHLAGDRMDQALAHIRQALDILDECSGEGPEFPQRDYLIAYQVLRADGQEQAARTALQSAYRLVMARAAKIADPALRQSFLEQVPANRQVVEAARQAGIE